MAKYPPIPYIKGGSPIAFDLKIPIGFSEFSKNLTSISLIRNQLANIPESIVDLKNLNNGKEWLLQSTTRLKIITRSVNLTL